MSFYEEIKQHDKIYMLPYLHYEDDEIIEDQIMTLNTSSLEESKNPDHALWVYGFPGPDIEVFSRENYGIGWAFTEQELLDKYPNSHTPNNVRKHELQVYAKSIGMFSANCTKYKYHGERVISISQVNTPTTVYYEKFGIYNVDTKDVTFLPTDMQLIIAVDRSHFPIRHNCWTDVKDAIDIEALWNAMN